MKYVDLVHGDAIRDFIRFVDPHWVPIVALLAVKLGYVVQVLEGLVERSCDFVVEVLSLVQALPDNRVNMLLLSRRDRLFRTELIKHRSWTQP